ncbi:MULTISPECIES: hypothetical protein [unclassified Olleya]|jgi:hypothetical protein|uniref:hypothetical protein n=1 Tax=unclassified Olleya TaxID=2615019 RepID=UPI00119DA750|nr:MULTISPECIES: hypothetical protein [unclassified Olleya]TVZ47272.1 hypothetical protein JM82_1873 [Olleya sp. Hel_I_94]|tara:strand:- start:28455 stop:29369 length:915 start_codon:yes stop_codon:yes gene_type:complete
MNSFFKNALLFTIPLLLVFIAIECFYRYVPNNYSYKNKQIQTQYGNIETLVFGDSHAFYGIDPKGFDRPTFNISNVSQSIYFDKLLFEKHVDSFPKLKNIILTVAYTTLSEVDDKLDLKWRKYFYKNHMGLTIPLISKYDLKQHSLALVHKLSKTIKYVRDYFKNGTLVTSDTHGFITTNLVENSTKDLDGFAKRVTINHEDGLLDFTQNTKRIQEIIKQCQSRDINVYLVSLPVNYRYVNLVNSKKVAKIYDTADALALGNSNTTYINLFEDNRFDDSDFFDANHLNVKGAKKCTVILNQIIQ